jgi:hypothetical protein
MAAEGVGTVFPFSGADVLILSSMIRFLLAVNQIFLSQIPLLESILGLKIRQIIIHDFGANGVGWALSIS